MTWVKFKDEEIAVANKTARVRPPGKVVSVVPRATMMLASKKNRILDFGAGPHIYHTKMLREHGYKVTAHDFGKNLNENHDINALNKRYDIVMASNVLNVQSSLNMLYATLRQIRSVMKDG